MAEFRKALAGVERERDQLQAEKEQRERAAREAAAAVAGARRRGGDGGLAAERRQSLGSAASGALPSPSSWFGGGGGADGGEAPLPSPLPSVRQRDTLEPTDVLYLKNGGGGRGWCRSRVGGLVEGAAVRKGKKGVCARSLASTPALPLVPALLPAQSC